MVKKSKEYRLHNQPVQDINFLEPEATYSYADYLKWSFEERVELIRGKLFRMAPAPSRDHQVLLSNLHEINYNNISFRFKNLTNFHYLIYFAKMCG